MTRIPEGFDEAIVAAIPEDCITKCDGLRMIMDHFDRFQKTNSAERQANRDSYVKSMVDGRMQEEVQHVEGQLGAIADCDGQACIAKQLLT